MVRPSVSDTDAPESAGNEEAEPSFSGTTGAAASDLTDGEVPVAAPDDGWRPEETFIDLTSASARSAYAFLITVALAPEENVGKTLRLQGDFRSFYDETKDRLYMAVFLSDETQCCTQGLYLFTDETPDRAALPPDGTPVVAEGEIAAFTMEDGFETGCLIHVTLSPAEA